MLVISTTAYTESDTGTQQQLSRITALKLQLFTDLNGEDIRSAVFDAQTDMAMAKVEMELASYYLSQGDRKNAAISAIIARKILQGIYANPYDPRLIPVYSLLVQIYDSKLDIDNPNVDSSDAAKAKEYRNAIDHIHAI